MGLPLLLDLTNRLCVVVGGGPVGRRKAQAILDSGGLVRLVCLEPQSSLTHPNLEWLKEPYQSRHLNQDVSLVFAAATPDTNRLVVADARRLGLWVNRADEPGDGDFVLPAVLRRGELTIAVGTGGASPLLAQTIRDQLETQFDGAFGEWASLLAEFRSHIQARCADPQKRRELLASLCRWEWLDRLRQEGIDAVRLAMHAELDTLFAENDLRL